MHPADRLTNSDGEEGEEDQEQEPEQGKRRRIK